MRTVHWLFAVSVALFICGIGFIVAAGRSLPDTARTDAPGTTPVATVRQIMNGIVQPNVSAVWGAVGTRVSAAGIEDWAPKNDEEWTTLVNNAAALIESGNLMLMGDRAVDRGDWVKMTREFMDASRGAMTAAEQQDTDAILTAGEQIYATCGTCHARYQRQ